MMKRVLTDWNCGGTAEAAQELAKFMARYETWFAREAKKALGICGKWPAERWNWRTENRWA